MEIGCRSATSWLSQAFKGIFLFLILQALCFHLYVSGEQKPQTDSKISDGVDFYSYEVVDIDDNIVSLGQYRGKVSLVVNVASKCGYTKDHYKELSLLQIIFSTTQKFNVLAFPCNQFGNQEPEKNKDISNFVYRMVETEFPLFGKINVKDHDISPAWSYLIEKSGQVPTWNFWKYLVNHKGHVIKAWGPSTSPEKLVPDIKYAIHEIDNDNGDSQKDDYKSEF